MSSRKAHAIARTLRDQILAGHWAPGARLPTYDALMEQFQVTRPTIARVLDTLREEGLVTVKGQRQVFVTERFPHHNRYLWVTSEQPGSIEWTLFLATILEVIERGESGIPGEVTALVGVDGRVNNPAYQELCAVVERGSAAGLLLVNSAMIYLLPVLQAPGLPRAAIEAPLPHAGLVKLDFEGLIERASARLFEKGRRVAVMSPHSPKLAATEQRLRALGRPPDQVWALQVAPIGCQGVTELLFDRKDRPDALFVTDDNLIEPLLEGLRRKNVKPGKDIYVLAHCNWPRPLGLSEGVEHIGFDAREVLCAGKECIDAQRAGDPSPTRTVPARFIEELTRPLPTR
jgi:DNA-binding transcriptional ArsR family regulator